MTNSILELRNVRASYGSIEVLHGVNLSVGRGEVVALLGPNGAGKSTMIKVVSGLLRPTSGQLVVGGRDVTGAAASALARAGLCTIPEGRGIFPNLTVRENLLMATFSGHKLSDIEESTYARFPRLSERRTQLAGTMSGGEQQMLSLARALATNPVILLLDELSMGLAPLIVAELYQQVAAIAAEGVSVLVVEQFARTVLGVADQAVLLAHGKVQVSGKASEIGEDVLAGAYLGSDNTSATPSGSPRTSTPASRGTETTTPCSKCGSFAVHKKNDGVFCLACGNQRPVVKESTPTNTNQEQTRASTNLQNQEAKTRFDVLADFLEGSRHLSEKARRSLDTMPELSPVEQTALQTANTIFSSLEKVLG